jgi:hypothetical protein
MCASLPTKGVSDAASVMQVNPPSLAPIASKFNSYLPLLQVQLNNNVPLLQVQLNKKYS